MSTIATLTRNDVRLNYVVDFYDWPRAGVLTWNGERYWFSEDDDTEGIWNIRALTADQWEYEDARNAAFIEHVGDHWSYDEAGRRTGAVRPAEQHPALLRRPSLARFDRGHGHP